jgi:Tryptophan dimethylallyltransferase
MSFPTLVTADGRVRDQYWHYLGGQAESLATRLGVPVAPARSIFDQLALDPLKGPFTESGCRFSGIQRDGTPFEWSASVGLSPGGLRFLVDHGIPGTSMAARTCRSLLLLDRLLEQLDVPDDVATEYQSLLRRLLPALPVLNHLVMGVWIGVVIDRRGSVGLKVYVNQQVGSRAYRFRRLIMSLIHLRRPRALTLVDRFRDATGDAVIPGGIAVELGRARIGRVKLYMRTCSGKLSFMSRAATALGCPDASERLSVYHTIMNSGRDYDPRAVILSVELPADDDDPAFKVEVNCMRHFRSDGEAHSRATSLMAQFGLDDTEYRALIRTCAPELSTRPGERLTWLGVALRGSEQRVNAYLHPGPRP